MKIEILEERIEDIKNYNLASIIELIIEAIKDFPLFGMNDTELYFSEVRKLIGSDIITPSSVNDYLKLHAKEERENNIWIKSSLIALLDAFNLMDLYKISFDEVQNEINNLT